MLAFPSGKSGREFFRKICGFEVFRFPEKLCWDTGNFFYVIKDFSGTDCLSIIPT